MGKPTEQQLQQAIATAISMREEGHDPHNVAKALLNNQYRLDHLEQVFKLTEHYLKAGQDEQIHARLVRAIEHYHQLEDRASSVDHLKFGLD